MMRSRGDDDRRASVSHPDPHRLRRQRTESVMEFDPATGLPLLVSDTGDVTLLTDDTWRVIHGQVCRILGR